MLGRRIHLGAVEPHAAADAILEIRDGLRVVPPLRRLDVLPRPWTDPIVEVGRSGRRRM